MHGHIGSRQIPIHFPETREQNEAVLDTRLSGLMEWEVLGGWCVGCDRIGWLDRKKLRRWFGDIDLRDVRRRLVCRSCRNRKQNTVIIGRMRR